MKESHKETILAFAANDMNIAKTAAYRLERINELYGLDPKNFYDLHKLVEMAQGGEG